MVLYVICMPYGHVIMGEGTILYRYLDSKLGMGMAIWISEQMLVFDYLQEH